MAIYYPPPQPYIGGRQPLEPGRLAPPLQVTPGDEPPRYSLVTFYAIVLKQWEPGPPPVQGSVGPQVKRVPATEESIGWASYVPQWPSIVAQTWIPGPPHPPRTPSTFPFPTVVAVNDPPFGPWQTVWVKSPYSIQGPTYPWFQTRRAAGLAVPAVNDPPTRDPIYRSLSTILAAWEPDLSRPFLGGGQPLQPRVLPVSISESIVNDPIFGHPLRHPTHAGLDIILDWWAPDLSRPSFGASQPLTPRYLFPSLLDVPVPADDPIPQRRGRLESIVGKWYEWQPQIVRFSTLIDNVQTPPPTQVIRGASSLLSTILRWWEPDLTRPFMGGWQPLDVGKIAPYDISPTVDLPPFAHPMRQSASGVVWTILDEWWEPDLRYPFVGGRQPLAPSHAYSDIPPGDPPFHVVGPFWTIMHTWEPGPPEMPIPLARWHLFVPRLTAATITGTAPPTITEAEVLAGGKTIIITLTSDTWVAAGATFNAQRQNIIDGLDSNQSGLDGWNAVVRATEVVSAVVRTSDTVVTITLSAFVGYNISGVETITITVPSTALVTSPVDLLGNRTFTVTPLGFASIGGVWLAQRPSSHKLKRLRARIQRKPH